MSTLRRPASFFRSLAAGFTGFLAVGLSAPSLAAPVVRTDFPCKGCLFFPPPAGATPAPLLVVLHGDAPGGKRPLVQRDSKPFVSAALERGIAVLAPMCPKEEGCLVGSFWQWTQGDPPAWIAKQIAEVRKDASIDVNRVWIAGWSGGASFLGYHYQRLGEHHAAVIFAGGGMPPVSNACASCSPPAYFLVGNKNPLHHLAKDLKTSVLACTKDVTWDLLPGKDHGGEWRALEGPGKVGELLDWLAKHPRNCPSTSAQPTAELVATAAAPRSFSPVEAAPAPSSIASVSKPPPEQPGGCTMVVPHLPSREAWCFVGIFVGVLSRRRRAHRHLSRA